jgi:hypothetical protein
MKIRFRTRMAVAATAAVVAGGLAALSFAAPARAEPLPIHEDFVVDCPPWEDPTVPGYNPQQCWRVHWNFFEPPETVHVRFTASRNHCSDINAKIALDNEQQQVIRLGPGQSTGDLEFKKRPFPGQQGIVISAEGIAGGCNTGTLSSWGGVVDIW